MGRLAISFSGGRSSAYMTKRLLDLAKARGDRDNVVVMLSNTAQEDERTLRFIHLCDTHFGFRTVWLEAVVSPEHGVGTSFRVVSYETASRKGEPFEDMIRKYGIPNANYPHCTRELKLRPMTAYLRSIGWEAGSYDTAIGIRADEIDRLQPDFRKLRITYPLARWGVRKADVIAWWQKQAFDLKSTRKLLTIAAEDPSAFDFMARMEREYPFTGPGEKAEPRRFFRSARSAEDILALSRQPFEPFRDENGVQGELDLGGACGDSCEIWADEMAA
jgi:hypothetical protein